MTSTVLQPSWVAIMYRAMDRAKDPGLQEPAKRSNCRWVTEVKLAMSLEQERGKVLERLKDTSGKSPMDKHPPVAATLTGPGSDPRFS